MRPMRILIRELNFLGHRVTTQTLKPRRNGRLAFFVTPLETQFSRPEEMRDESEPQEVPRKFVDAAFRGRPWRGHWICRTGTETWKEVPSHRYRRSIRVA